MSSTAIKFEETVTTAKSFEEAVEAVTSEVAKAGFRVQHIHDVQATFREKGSERDPYKIIEVCNIKYAKKALDIDPLVGLMMPCKINVYEDKGETKISLMLPSAMSLFFPHAGLEPVADEVEGILRQVIEAAR